MSVPHVAICIPSAGQRVLANLARDAIAKFTQDVSHEVLLLDTAPMVDRGSEANGFALDRLIQGALWGTPCALTHVFVMHDDALPIRERWLSYLLDQVGPSYLLDQHGPVIGVKASERNGYPHSSGVLFTIDFARSHSMLPDLPTRDTAEWPGWCAYAYCHRRVTADAGPWPPWWWPFSCDVSYENATDPSTAFYAHFGGGSLNNRPDRDAWIAAARKALDL